MEQATVKRLHTGHTPLLARRTDKFQRGIFPAFVRQYRQSQGHANTVVSAEGRIPGNDLISLNLKGNRVFCKVVLHARVFLADHIHMCLQNHAGSVLKTFAGRPAHDDVVCVVRLILQAVGLGKLHQIGTDGGLVSGFTRNAC